MSKDAFKSYVGLELDFIRFLEELDIRVGFWELRNGYMIYLNWDCCCTHDEGFVSVFGFQIGLVMELL